MKETWKYIPKYEGWYSASSLGNIRREKKGCSTQIGRILNKQVNLRGYSIVSINNIPNKSKAFKVAFLIAQTFLGIRPYGKVINHKNGIKTDDSVGNLEYITQSMNIIHSYEVLGHKPPSGKNHWNGKKTECNNGHAYSTNNTSISNGRRICKTCRRNNKLMKKNGLLKETK